MLYQTIQIPLTTHAYPVYVGRGLLSQTVLFERHIKGKQVMIVTQENLVEPYLKPLLRTLSAYRCEVTLIPQGERYKSLATWQKILANLVAKGHDRSSTLLSLGGGMIGDLTGFAAACYQRGIGYIQLPTTLIAQVDAALGGKTGVNHRAGKNLIGAFHQPLCVFADTAALETLPRREYVAGLAEVIKYGLIRDASFFSWLETKLDALLQGGQEAILHAVSTSVGIKGQIVAQDEREQAGLRSLLNFGHTLGHALEALFNYRLLLHGEAVAIGMNLAARLSVERGCLAEKDYLRIQAMLAASGLPLTVKKKVDAEKLFSYLLRDKKSRGQRLNWVLLKGIGEAFLTEQVAGEEVLRFISSSR